MKQPYVSTLIEQNFTSGEKARARDNIDAISSADLTDYATHDWVEEQGYLTSADIPSPIPEASAYQFLASDQLGNMDWKSLKLIDDRVQAGAYINLERQEYTDHVETTINCTGLQPSGDYVETSAIADMATQTWVNEQTSAFVTSADVSGALGSYATKQYVSSVAQGITVWAEGEFYPLSNPSHFITSADVPPQIEYSAGQNVSINDHVISAVDTTYSAGPNIDIYNEIISTEKTVVTAGPGVTITSSQEPQTRITTYQISSSGATYTAGYGVEISNTNEISAKTKLNGGLVNDSNGLSVYNKVPNSPGQYHYLRSTSPTHDAFSWRPLMKTKFMGSTGSHVLTETDLANGYCDILVGWGLPLASGSPMEGHVPTNSNGYLMTDHFNFFLEMYDADYNNGTGSNGLAYQCDHIESGVWDANGYAGCDLFGEIAGTELERVPGRPFFVKTIRRIGSSRLGYSFYAPAFRVYFKTGHILQVGWSVGISANVRGIYMPETEF